MVSFRELHRPGRKTRQGRSSAPPQEPLRRSPSVFRLLAPETEAVKPDDSGAGSTPSSEQIVSLYEEAFAYLHKVFDAVRRKKTFDLAKGRAIILQMVEIAPGEDSLFIKAMYFDKEIDFLINKCINVAIYAIRIGRELDFDQNKLVALGLAALLHEVGMFAIPDHILYKKSKLSEEEFRIVKQHSDFGYKILSGLSDSPYGFLADVVLQIHERRDGSGYPMGLAGDEIHEFSQLIGLVDMYEAISHSRPQRDKFSHFHAIREVIKIGKKNFSRSHLRALLNCFSVFPLSSYVRLNSRALGKVIETFPDFPLRPKLQIVLDSQGRDVTTKRIVDLRKNSLLYITDAVLEEEVKNRGQKPAGIREAPEEYSDKEGFFLPEKWQTGSGVTPDRPLRGVSEVFAPKPKFVSRRLGFKFIVGAILILAAFLVLWWLFHRSESTRPENPKPSVIRKMPRQSTSPNSDSGQGVSGKLTGQKDSV